MPCDTQRRKDQTEQDRKAQIKAALGRLERYLTTGSVRLTIGPTGAVAFVGWKDRDDVTDVCAYRTLTTQRSQALRMAVMRAEATAGRKVSAGAVASGEHSHDNGKTWHPGH